MEKPLKKTVWVLGTVFLSLSVSGNIYASEKIVGKTLIASKDSYAINEKGEKRTLARGSPIFEKDRLVTGQGKAQIWFQDGALFTLSPKTEFRVHEYSPKPQQESSVVALLKGGFRTATGSIAILAPERYLVNTPVATIGVRGTHYQVASSNECLTTGKNAPECKFGVWRSQEPDAQTVVVTVGEGEFLLDNAHPAMLIEAGVPRYAEIDELDWMGEIDAFLSEDEILSLALSVPLEEKDLQLNEKDLEALIEALDTFDEDDLFNLDPDLAALLSDEEIGSLLLSDL